MACLRAAHRRDRGDPRTPTTGSRARPSIDGQLAAELPRGRLHGLLAEHHHLAGLGVDNRVGQLARHTTRYQEARQAADAARVERAAARQAVVAAGDQLQRLSPWRLSSWQLRPTFESGLRDANDRLRAASRNVEHADAALDQAATARDHAQNWVDQHQVEIARWPHVNTELARDLAARTLAVRHQVPDWALEALGPRPRDPRATPVWDRAVAGADQYRTAWAVTSRHDPLGPRPALGTDHETDWHAATRALHEAAHNLDNPLGRHRHDWARRGPAPTAQLGPSRTAGRDPDLGLSL